MVGRKVFGLVSVLLLVSAIAWAQTPAPASQEPARPIPLYEQGVPATPGPDVINPRLIREVSPRYTSEAMRARIEGQVRLQVVIQKDGTVGDVRVVQSLDATNGLDQEAIKAAKQWLFQPALLRATRQPVDYRATLELSFRIFGSSMDFDTAYKEGAPGLVPPKALTMRQPDYTAEARAAGIQGQVQIEVVVGPSGTVKAARIKQGIDKGTRIEADGRTLFRGGLDDEAQQAALRWTFEPGTLNGSPVHVLVVLSFDFKLK